MYGTTSCLGATTCSYSGCAPGFADCDKAPPNTNGCETATTSTTNCAGCGNKCDTTNSIGAACTGTSCVYTGCKPGWADCNTTAPDLDGCETPIGGTSGCGGCGKTCDSTHSLGAMCTGGTSCSYTGCAPGYGDCNSTPPNTDGCDTALNTVTNCGACGVKCDSAT
ncbi:MAG: hypothetical protein ACXWVM_09220, partial [Polyangiales bacterium]